MGAPVVYGYSKPRSRNVRDFVEELRDAEWDVIPISTDSNRCVGTVHVSLTTPSDLYLLGFFASENAFENMPTPELCEHNGLMYARFPHCPWPTEIPVDQEEDYDRD